MYTCGCNHFGAGIISMPAFSSIDGAQLTEHNPYIKRSSSIY